MSGEDSAQVEQFIKTYLDLVKKISDSSLPLALKASALNNMALAKILHHFYNSRLSEEQLEDIDKSVTKTVREMYALYTTTTNLVIYLPREYGGIGVKRVSDVYRTTRLAFLVKMLNHDVPQFRNMARESLRLDMVKRGVPLSENSDNFLGYDLNANGFLNARTRFGCQSDWPDILRYARKLGVKMIFRNGKAEITHNDLTLDETPKLQNRLFRITIDRDLQKSKELSIQGPFLGLNDIQIKASHSILYNWNISDDLVRFAIKARLSLLPTNFTTHIWNRTMIRVARFVLVTLRVLLICSMDARNFTISTVAVTIGLLGNFSMK